jgi:hypothetical protein
VIALLAVGTLWLALVSYGVRRWRRALAVTQRDAQLKALLAGSLVPGPRVPGLRPAREPELASPHVARRAGAAAAR